MEYNSPKFRKWLDKLQQESWQLELIISGFAIYGLIMALEPLETNMITTISSDLPPLATFWLILLLCCQILIINMVLHVLLRGLWIGAIGLRYVSGDIDYEKLNYSEKFTEYLKRKVGSFDHYISRLENYCSVMFAVSFLLIFYVIGFFLVMITIGFILNGLELLDFLPKSVIDILKVSIGVLALITALITFIDFIGQGFLKKKKWTSKLFFPIYWLFSKLTLSFLYRPLAYNFLDNKLGKRLSLFLVPIYIILTVLGGITYQNSNYLNILKESTEYYASYSNYDNEMEEPTQFTQFASITSKVIKDPFLRVFIVYSEIKEDFVFEKNEKLKPKDDERGLNLWSRIAIKTGSKSVEDINMKQSLLPKYIEAVDALYVLNIDDVAYPTNFIFSYNQKNKIGFETYLNIRNLSEGKHILTITGPIKKNDEDEDEDNATVMEVLTTIPFWYFPENPTPMPVVAKTNEEQLVTTEETAAKKTN